LFRQSLVARTYREAGQPWEGDVVRLDTQWQWNFPDRMIAVTAGDTLSSSLSWGRTLRLGGVRIGRDFGLQPYRSVTPLPEFLGEAAVPSSVDLYINGVRQYGADVPAGPFQLGGIPGVDGAGNAQLVVTDAFGRTRTIDFPFYASQDLLDGGLSDWSIAAGRVRQGYGLDSFDYGDRLVASASWRRGVSDRLTAEAHAEAGGDVVNAGAGAIWLIERAGVFSASMAGSQAGRLSGQQYALAWRWNTGRYNLALDTQRSRGDYRDVASLYGAAPPRVSERALAGITFASLGNFSLSYVRAEYARMDPSRYASLFWSRSLFGASSISFSANQNLEDRRDRSLYLGWNVALGPQHQAGTSWQRANARDFGTVDVSRVTPADGGRGWRVQARTGEGNAGGLAESRWRLQHGNYAAGIASLGGDTYGYAEASGGLVGMGGSWFLSRELDQAFALVETGVAGVPVRLQNRTIGVTDRDGRLLVTPLNPWQQNEVSINPMDLPVDLRPQRVEQTVIPRDRTGVRVQFPIRRVHAALIILHDAQGQPLPVGSRVSVAGGNGNSVVGYDGETYLEFLGSGGTTLQVERPDGRCQARFDYPEKAGLPRIGPLRCEATP
jgi:outer membrane usher protein